MITSLYIPFQHISHFQKTHQTGDKRASCEVLPLAGGLIYNNAKPSISQTKPTDAAVEERRVMRQNKL